MFDDNGKNDLRLIYQLISDDIKFAKNQQWAIINYSLLLIAGLFGFIKIKYQCIASITGYEKILIILFFGVIPIIATIMYIFNIISLCNYKKKLTKINKYLPKEIQDILGKPSKKCFPKICIIFVHIVLGIIVWSTAIFSINIFL